MRMSESATRGVPRPTYLPVVAHRAVERPVKSLREIARDMARCGEIWRDVGRCGEIQAAAAERRAHLRVHIRCRRVAVPRWADGFEVSAAVTTAAELEAVGGVRARVVRRVVRQGDLGLRSGLRSGLGLGVGVGVGVGLGLGLGLGSGLGLGLGSGSGSGLGFGGERRLGSSLCRRAC